MVITFNTPYTEKVDPRFVIHDSEVHDKEKCEQCRSNDGKED